MHLMVPYLNALMSIELCPSCVLSFRSPSTLVSRFQRVWGSCEASVHVLPGRHLPWDFHLHQSISRSQRALGERGEHWVKLISWWTAFLLACKRLDNWKCPRATWGLFSVNQIMIWYDLCLFHSSSRRKGNWSRMAGQRQNSQNPMLFCCLRGIRWACVSFASSDTMSDL